MFGMIPYIPVGVPCVFCGENGEGGKVKGHRAWISVQMLRSGWEIMTAKLAPWFPNGESGLYADWRSNWTWSWSHTDGRYVLGIALPRAGLFPYLILSPVFPGSATGTLHATNGESTILEIKPKFKLHVHLCLALWAAPVAELCASRILGITRSKL